MKELAFQEFWHSFKWKFSFLVSCVSHIVLTWYHSHESGVINPFFWLAVSHFTEMMEKKPWRFTQIPSSSLSYGVLKCKRKFIKSNRRKRKRFVIYLISQSNLQKSVKKCSRDSLISYILPQESCNGVFFFIIK